MEVAARCTNLRVNTLLGTLLKPRGFMLHVQLLQAFYMWNSEPRHQHLHLDKALTASKIYLKKKKIKEKQMVVTNDIHKQRTSSPV